jgi:carboxylesterase
MNLNREYVFEGDNGAGMLLLHGSTSGASQFRPLAAFLNMYGFTTYGVNIAGHGEESGDALKGLTDEDMIQKAEADLATVKAKHNKVFVIGFSLGGLLTLYLASKHQDLAGIVPMAPAVLLKMSGFHTMKYETEYAHKPLDNKSGLYKMYHNHYENVPVSYLTKPSVIHKEIVTQNGLKNITCPIFVIQPLNDGSVEPATAQYVCDHVSSADKQFMMVQGGGHVFLLSEYRYEPYEKTVEFLLRLL